MQLLEYVENLEKEKALEVRRTKDKESYTDFPQFKSGDEINVAVRVVEGEKERIQNYKGVVIARKGNGVNQTFRVRKISNGVGVERIFPLFSPMIQSISVLKEGHVRRAKLYYLRGMSEKKIRQKLH